VNKHLSVRKETAEQIKMMAEDRGMTIVKFVQWMANQVGDDGDLEFGLSDEEKERLDEAKQFKEWTTVSVTKYTAEMLNILSEKMLMDKYVIIEGLVRGTINAYHQGSDVIYIKKWCKPVEY
jgi:hypothetical protein